LIHTPGESFDAHENVASVFAEPDAASITIPDAHFLFTADFKRKGSDLVLTGDDGHKILVPDYFRHDKQPDLVSPEGALLSASLVELLAGSATPGQYAQAAAPAAQQPIGRVETVSGSATVTRNGVAVDLNVGDLVFQGDVVQTRSDSTLGIGFADGSAFSMKENARMALNEFVYDPNGTANSALINLVQGTVSFIAAQVAKTGNMRVDTPTAMLGIRGTFVTVDVSSVDGHTVASLGLETNLTTGEQFAGSFTLTNRITNNQVNVTSVNSLFSVSPNGAIGESAKPPAVHAIEGQSFQALSAIAAATAAGMGTGPTGPNLNLNATPDIPSGPGNAPAPGGSSGPSSAPTNTSPIDNHPTTTTSTTTPVDTPPANTGPTNIPNTTNQTNTPLALTNTLPVSDIKPTVAPTDTTKTTDTPKTVDDHNPVTQPVTVTLPGTNNAPVINGGPIVASVQEDGGTATRATGQLTATDPDQADTQTWSIVGASPTHAPNFQFKIDEFKVVKNGTVVVLDDQFSDNNPPPSAPPPPSGPTLSYSVTGTISESGGRAVLNGSNAGFGTGSPAGDPFFGQYATLNTNINPSDSAGLKSNSSFTVSGLFDLTLPAEDRNEYGIRLTDRTASQAGDSTVELRVARGADGIERVQLREIDFASGTRTLLQSFNLNPGTHDQILLSLTNDSENTGVIHASFQLEQGGVLDGATLTNFTFTGTVFNNENWTRAQFFAEAPAQSDSVLQGTYGQLDITQAGAWTYQLANGQANVQALPAGLTVQDIFTAQVADGHGGFGTKTITVNVTGTNDAPVVTSAAAAVSEEGLPNGVADTLPAILDTTNSTSASGTIIASDVDTGDALTMTLGTPSTSLTSGGVAIAWTLQNTNHTLVGKAGATTIVTATITNAGAYNVTLSGPIDHPVAGQEDDKTLIVPVTVSDGHTTTPTTLSVSIEDDSPKAAPVEVSVDTTDSQTNVMLIVDVSGSMNSSSGVDGFPTRLAAAKEAMKELLDQYDSLGDVRVQIVKFSTNAEQVGTDWMSVAAAKTEIDGLSAGGSTFYDAALTTAMDIFGGDDHPGKLTGSGTQNVSYFLSDGVPTLNHAVNHDQQNDWESFLTTNDIVSFALGISDAPTTTDLNPIAFDPASGTQLADTPIIVTDLNDLTDTLVFTASSASGSLLSGANSFGADGGHVQSITVDGVTYTFNPTTNSITTSGGAGSFTYNAATKTLTVDTDTGASGGELAMVMTTGAFTFQPPTGFTSESVGFVLVDGDGDTASSTLQLTANILPAGVAGSPINLGLSDPAGHVGPVTVTIAGVPAGWTVNGGADNGHGGWTIQATNVPALSITSPDNYTGAMAFKVTMSWTNADHSSGYAGVIDNVEVFAPGAPIVAWSGDDHLTGSSGPNLFVFAQPIGHDTIYSFDASEDQIDLIGYGGFTNFNDVQRHLAEDNAGNAVIALGTGQSIALLGVAASALTASNFVFDQAPVLNNAGAMTIGNGALLPLGGIINNAGTIALDSTGSETHLQLIQYGITLHGGGQLVLSDSGENFISGTLPSVTLTNVDNTISGAGQFGAGQMTLVNDGTIVATGLHALVIDTGENAVTNTGTLEATGSGGLIVNSDVANSGLIWAHGGNITINGAVTGSGTAMISGAATLGFGAASSADITFAADAAGTLTLKDAADFTGTISGFSSNDQIDLTNISYSIASVSNASYSSSTNITTLVITDGTSTDAIKFVGNYTINTAWHFSGDGHGGTLVTDSLPGGGADLAQTVTAALNMQDATLDQFTFQGDSQSGTLAGDSTLAATGQNASATDAATLDASASTDNQPAATATAVADTGPASNVATTPQAAAADSATSGTQAGATTQTASAAPAVTGVNGDTFVLAANFGHETISNFHPDTDVIEIDHTIFADFHALLAATHDDGNGNAVIAANPNDTITVKNVTVAQLVQHQSDFHFT
jgi:T1SS-143 domain-containing protein